MACEQAGFEPQVLHVSDDFRAVAALAATGAGVALVPRLALRGVDTAGAVAIPLTDPAPTRRPAIADQSRSCRKAESRVRRSREMPSAPASVAVRQ